MSSRPLTQYERLRITLPGYPMEFKFLDPEKLAAYFAGESIVCLRCGKEYRTLGKHLQMIHEMDPDEYRDIYGIPWTYGLSCGETKQLKAEQARFMLESGAWEGSTAENRAKAHVAPRRKRQPIRDVYIQRNLEKLNRDKPGDVAERRRNATKRGTEAFHEKMQARPQCQPDATRERFGDYWKGREQSDEHVFKRTGHHKKGNHEEAHQTC